MRKLIWASLALTLGAAAPSQPVPLIAYRMTSWGKEAGGFTISRSGEGQFVRDVSATADPSRPELVTTMFRLTPGDFDQIAALLAPARAAAEHRPACPTPMTDQIDATLSWSSARSKGSVEIYYGCDSPAWRRVFAAVGAARKRVETLAQRGITLPTIDAK
jgi:hypothetical protein